MSEKIEPGEVSGQDLAPHVLELGRLSLQFTCTDRLVHSDIIKLQNPEGPRVRGGNFAVLKVRATPSFKQMKKAQRLFHLR